jgi:ankyrin repeat protein
MRSLVNLALDGSLKPSDLIGREKEIDAVDKATLYTPLGTAVFYRQKEAIKLLLDNGANPNGVPESFPPLWIAAARTKGHIGSIVGMLLAHKADVNIASDLTKNTTPLTALVKRYRGEDDIHVIEALVDAGADPHATNNRRESAMSIATARNDKKMLAILSPHNRKHSHLRNLGMLVSLIVFVIAWVNKRPEMMAAAGMSAAAIGGYGPLKKRFKISGLAKAEIPPVCFASLFPMGAVIY